MPPPPDPGPENDEVEERSPALDLDRLQELIRQTFRDEVRKLGGNLAKIGTEGGGGGEEP